MFWKYEYAEPHFSAFWGIFSQLLGCLVSKTESLPHAVFPLLMLANTGCMIMQNTRALRKIISCDVIEQVSDVFSFPAHGLHSWRNSITTTGLWEILIPINVAYYIELLKTVGVKRCVQAKA